MKAEVICTGTELLLGQIINSNARIFSQGLAALGIDLYSITTVGDNQKRIEEAIRLARSRADIIILNGGLGPTADDCSREALVAVLGRGEEVHGPSLAKIKAYSKARQLKAVKNVDKVARVPKGAQVFTNPVGSAPASISQEDGKVFILTPGPPYELTTLLEENIYPWLKQKYGLDATIVSRLMKVINMGESTAEDRVKDLVLSANPSLAPTIKKGEIHFRITAKAKTRALAEGMLDDMEAKFRQRMEGYIYGVDEERLEAVIGQILRRLGLTIACAESCTGGLLASTLTDVPGASDYVNFSCLTYNNEWKASFLGVPVQVLEKRGAVSAETVQAMAQGIARLAKADIGLAVSGIAGPTGGSLEKPVGLVYLGVFMDGQVYHKKLLLGRDRLLNKELSVRGTLAFLYEILDKKGLTGRGH